MAKTIPKPCKRCNQLTSDRSGYCEQHKKTESGWYQWQKKKGTRKQRGYGAAWERLRKEIILRDNGLCQECLRHGTVTQGSDVDHIKPKYQGGTDALTNLELLCKACHKRKTNSERRGRGE